MDEKGGALLTVLAADAVLDEHDGRVTGGDGRSDVILERRLAAQQGLGAACTGRPRETSVACTLRSRSRSRDLQMMKSNFGTASCASAVEL